MNSTINEEGNPAAFTFWLRFWRKVIAGLQIAGGVGGVYIVAFGNMVGSTRIILLLAFVLFIVGIWGGILLMLGRRGGVAVSLIVQALQLVQVALPVFIYSFVCGLQIIIGTFQNEAGTNLGLYFSFGSRFFLFFNPPPGVALPGGYTGLNMTAVLAIICLLYVCAEERRVTVSHKLDMQNVHLETAKIWPPKPKP
jgi:hypothetical protein